MITTHKISFQGGKPFEQHSAEFTLEGSDFDGADSVFSSLNILEKMFLMNTFVIIEGLLFQFSDGYISSEEYKSRLERQKSLLSPKLLEAFSKIVKN